MLLENQDFYALGRTEIGVPLKQKMFSFQEEVIKRTKRIRSHNLSALGFTNPEIKLDGQKNHFALRPKLPSKKLFEQPRFFMSLQRKKVRIIDGLKNVTKFEQKSATNISLRGNKLKGQHLKQPKHGSPTLSKSALYAQKIQTFWQPKSKTPFLNYNMQYLIRKRKMMTPGAKLSHQTIKIFGKGSQ